MSLELDRDEEFTRSAKIIGLTYSKDPSAKCGSVIVSAEGTQVAWGYNKFPRGIANLATRWNDRRLKYPRVLHAEMVAILECRAPLRGATLYSWPHFTCRSCAMHIIEAGITRVVFPPPGSLEGYEGNFDNPVDLAHVKADYEEAGVEWVEILFSTLGDADV